MKAFPTKWNKSSLFSKNHLWNSSSKQLFQREIAEYKWSYLESAKQGDQMFLLKNRPKTMKNGPKSRPTMFLLDLLYKTVLWCFLFDFMLISNGTGHSFIVFLNIKEEINFFEYFWKTCKKPLFKQNFSLIKVNFGQLGLKFRTNHWAIFSRKK
jgi:hypothetical protein